MEHTFDNPKAFLEQLVLELKCVRFNAIMLHDSYAEVVGTLGAFSCKFSVTSKLFKISMHNALGASSIIDVTLDYKAFRTEEFDKLSNALSRLNIVSIIFGESGHIS